MCQMVGLLFLLAGRFQRLTPKVAPEVRTPLPPPLATPLHEPSLRYYPNDSYNLRIRSLFVGHLSYTCTSGAMFIKPN